MKLLDINEAAEALGISRWTVAAMLETGAYREESDPLAPFLDEHCTIEPDAEIGKGELYKAFREWAAEAGEREMSQRDFSRRVGERGFEGDKNWRGHLWRGLRLTKNESDHDAT